MTTEERRAAILRTLGDVRGRIRQKREELDRLLDEEFDLAIRAREAGATQSEIEEVGHG